MMKRIILMLLLGQSLLLDSNANYVSRHELDFCNVLMWNYLKKFDPNQLKFKVENPKDFKYTDEDALAWMVKYTGYTPGSILEDPIIKGKEFKIFIPISTYNAGYSETDTFKLVLIYKEFEGDHVIRDIRLENPMGRSVTSEALAKKFEEISDEIFMATKSSANNRDKPIVTFSLMEQMDFHFMPRIRANTAARYRKFMKNYLYLKEQKIKIRKVDFIDKTVARTQVVGKTKDAIINYLKRYKLDDSTLKVAGHLVFGTVFPDLRPNLKLAHFSQNYNSYKQLESYINATARIVRFMEKGKEILANWSVWGVILAVGTTGASYIITQENNGPVDPAEFFLEKLPEAWRKFSENKSSVQSDDQDQIDLSKMDIIKKADGDTSILIYNETDIDTISAFDVFLTIPIDTTNPK